MKKKLMACEALLLPTLALTGCGSQFGDKMIRAGMNTLMGMGTVFVVLIFIYSLHFSYQDLNTSVSWRTGSETVRRRMNRQLLRLLLKNRRQMRKKLMKRMIWLLWQ